MATTKQPTGDNDRAEDITGELEPIPVDSEAKPSPLVETDWPSRGLAKLLLQGLIGVAVLVILAADSSNFLDLEEIAAILLIVFGGIELVGVVVRREGFEPYIQPTVLIGAGIMILIWPSETRRVVGLILGVVVLIRGGADLWRSLRRRFERGANMWVFVRGLILIAVGGLVLLIPAAAVPAAVVGVAILLVLRALLGIWYTTTRSGDNEPIDPGDTYSIIAYLLASRDMASEDIDRIDDIVFLHRGESRQRVTRFAILMALSTAIATFGIATDSTAVVIGAMLVAPLMTPILGLSAGLINGKTQAALFSAAVVLGGSVGAIGFSWMLGALIPNIAEVIENGQVVSRTAPSLLDLAIAIAAGIAGAYGVSKAETSDALPGVAVAIALIPPLSVIGITLHASDLSQAAGATLLFLTNLFAIILMAGIVFLIVGYGSWSRLHYRRNRIRTSFALVVLAVILISIPLALTAESVVGSSNDLRNASAAVNDWIKEEFPDDEVKPLRISTIDVGEDTVTVQLIGWEVPPSSDRLSEILSEYVGRPIGAVVRWVREYIDFTPESDPALP